MTELQILNDHQLGKTGGGVYNSLKHQWLIDLNLIPGAKSRDHIPKDNFSLPLLYPCHQRSIGDRRSSVTSRCSLKRDLVVIIISSSGSLTSRLRGTNSLQLRLPLDTFQSKIRLTAHFPSQKLVFFQTLMYRLTPGSVELCAVCWQHSDRLLGWWSFFFFFSQHNGNGTTFTTKQNRFFPVHYLRAIYHNIPDVPDVKTFHLWQL